MPPSISVFNLEKRRKKDKHGWMGSRSISLVPDIRYCFCSSSLLPLPLPPSALIRFSLFLYFFFLLLLLLPSRDSSTDTFRINLLRCCRCLPPAACCFLLLYLLFFFLSSDLYLQMPLFHPSAVVVFPSPPCPRTAFKSGEARRRRKEQQEVL